MRKRYTLHTAQETAKAIGWHIEPVAAWFGDSEHKEKYVLFRMSGLCGNTKQYIFANSLKALIDYATAEEDKLSIPQYC